MRNKIILIISIAFIITILIYWQFKPNKHQVIVLGDSANINMYQNIPGMGYNDYFEEYLYNKYSNARYIDYYIKTNLFVLEQTNNITNNMEINHNHIKKDIHESDYVILNIGTDELESTNNKMILDSKYILNYCKNYEDLVKSIYHINKKIILINYPIIEDIDIKKLNVINDYIWGIKNKYNLGLIDISSIDQKNHHKLNLTIYSELIKHNHRPLDK